MPVGNSICEGNETLIVGSGTTATATSGIGSTGDAQQAQLHRMQNAGHPPSGADSLALIEHASGTNSELMPAASRISTAKTAMKNARRTS